MKVLGKTRRLHFVGIGGIGMSGLAELLVNLGYQVSGSDLKRSDTTDRLASLGVEIHLGHDASHIRDADVVVFSSAVRSDNPEVRAARAAAIPVIPRAELLGELMRLRFGIAVAGAHGKTTTTSMIALVLERAGFDPTAVIGGRFSAFGSNARLGQGACMVAEADESDRSFLKLYPTIAVMTNLDREHMEAYGSVEELQDAFTAFANRVPFYGSVVMCADDPGLMAIRPRLTRRVVTYSLDTARDADVAGEGLQLEGFGSRCVVQRRVAGRGTPERLGTLCLRVPGRHSAQNALAAVAVGLELEIPFEAIAAALEEFPGVERRFQHVGTVGGVRVIDDYGHHPTEIAAVLAAARAAQPSRVIVAFQPHRYSRTRDLMREFGLALAAADEVVLTDIYPAGESPIAGITIEALAASVNASRAVPARVVRALDDVPGAIAVLAQPGDLVITLGAGSIGSAARQVVAALEERFAGASSRRSKA